MSTPAWLNADAVLPAGLAGRVTAAVDLLAPLAQQILAILQPHGGLIEDAAAVLDAANQRVDQMALDDDAYRAISDALGITALHDLVGWCTHSDGIPTEAGWAEALERVLRAQR